MKHFIDHKGQPATIKFVPLTKVSHFGSFQRSWATACKWEGEGRHKIVEIKVTPYTQANIYVEAPNKSPWAGKWICTNFNPQTWITLSVGDTEEEALENYRNEVYAKTKGVRKGEAWSDKRLSNAIKCNEKEQVKHYGQTTLDALKELPEEYQHLISYPE